MDNVRTTYRPYLHNRTFAGNVNFGSGHGLPLSMQEGVTWNNEDTIHWGIIASQSTSDFMP